LKKRTENNENKRHLHQVLLLLLGIVLDPKHQQEKLHHQFQQNNLSRAYELLGKAM
jgi:hypothetical protein